MDSTMIKNLADTLMTQFDRKTFSIMFPKCFDVLFSDDAKFEIMRSISLQNLRLVYSHNVVTKSVAVIIVHTFIGGPTDDTIILDT